MFRFNVEGSGARRGRQLCLGGGGTAILSHAGSDSFCSVVSKIGKLADCAGYEWYIFF